MNNSRNENKRKKHEPQLIELSLGERTMIYFMIGSKQGQQGTGGVGKSDGRHIRDLEDLLSLDDARLIPTIQNGDTQTAEFYVSMILLEVALDWVKETWQKNSMHPALARWALSFEEKIENLKSRLQEKNPDPDPDPVEYDVAAEVEE